MILNVFKLSKIPISNLKIFRTMILVPLGWEHINLLGEYNFDFKNILESDELRPLNINNL